MSVLFRARDLAIKALMRRQWQSLRSISPRLAVIPHEHVGLAVATNGLYEREEIDCLKQMIEQQSLGSGICLDIGANIGNHAVIWAGLFEKVLCFEPNPDMASLLRANLVLSRCKTVDVIEVGLGSDDAELPFSFSDPGNDGTGSFAGGDGEFALPVRHGDHLIRSLDLGQRAITFVKCDVEGFEDSVFTGLKQTLTEHRPVIAFESNAGEAGLKSWAILKGYGYTHLHEIRHNAATSSPIVRELMRLAQGHRCTLTPIEAPPAYAANLVAAPQSLVP